MLKSDVVTCLDCLARIWLEGHTEPLSPFVTASPGPCCANACPVLGRCSAGQQYTALVQSDSIRREGGLPSAAAITPRHSPHLELSLEESS